jgi:DNA adenine methylase
MQYFGGKAKIAKDVASILARYDRPCYVEPFVGGGWVAAQVRHSRKVLCDLNPALIAMWRGLQAGWLPPEELTEDEYAAAKLLPDTDPLKAFVGFGCSFGGKWFGGFARTSRSGDKVRSYVAESRRSVLRKIAAMRDAEFRCCSYASLRPRNCLVYCDPPYAGTTSYAAVGAFDSAAFWEWAREFSRTNTILVSEYTAPADFVPVWSRSVAVTVNGQARDRRTEHLFIAQRSE